MFLVNGILLTITAFVIRTISMFFNIYISNKIGSEAVGIYQLIMSVYMFGITIANSGINLTTTRIVSEQEAVGFKNGIKDGIRKCLIYSIIMGLAACFLLFIFSPFITFNWLHDKISPIPLKILAISLPFISISSYMNGYFCALRKIKKTIASQILEELSKIFLISFFINFFMPDGLEYACISLVLGTTISEFLSFILLCFLFNKDKNKLPSYKNKNNNYTKQILRIAIPISFTSYIRSGLSCLKQVLIPNSLKKSGLSIEHSLSEYGIINGMAMPLIMFPCFIISSFSSLLIPEFSYMNVKKEDNKMNFVLDKILKFCFIFSFLIMGFFWCFSNELSNFIYPDINVSVYIKILSPLIILMYIDNIVDNILKGLDKQVSVMGINILDLISSITLIYFLLPIKGINGYIIVLFVSEILNGILSLILLIKQTNLKINFSDWIIKPFISILILNTIFSQFFIANSLLEFILYSIIFIICYFIFILIFKVFNKAELIFLGLKR